MFKEKDERLDYQSRDYSGEVRIKLANNEAHKVCILIGTKIKELKKADKGFKTQAELKEVVSIAVGVVTYDYENAKRFSAELLKPVQECIGHNSPLIRYHAIECAVNLTLILKENMFCETKTLIDMIINSLRDVNVKVRSAA